MIRDITLGQYYQGASWIHRLDPRTKIIAVLVYIAGLFIVHSLLGMVMCTVVLAAVIAVSRVPLSFILRGLKPIFIIILLTFILNLFMYDGRNLCRIWILTITWEGLYPLERLGVPAGEIAMMMSIALRFIPTLLEETDKIMKAQQARGADFETGNILVRARRMLPILVPLFISAFRIAQDMAMAMEARCYRGAKGRTRMNPMRFAKRDTAAAILMGIFLGACILERIML